MWTADKPLAKPDDTWGVLGPTKCPLCRGLRRNPLFAVLLACGIIGAIYMMGEL